MMYLADLSGMIFLTAAGMLYAIWKLYREQEIPAETSSILNDNPPREQEEISADPVQLS